VRRTGRLWSHLSALLVTCLLAASAPAQRGTPKGEWPFYGGDSGSTKYSPLDQINRNNVTQLKIAWSWDSPDLKKLAAAPNTRIYTQEGTPIAIGGVLYISTALGHVVAINAQSGQTIWDYDSQSFKAGRPTNNGFLHRGVAYWTDSRQERIFIGTSDAYLVALDAKTGKPIPDFGENGRVNLARAVPRAVNARNYAERLTHETTRSHLRRSFTATSSSSVLRYPTARRIRKHHAAMYRPSMPGPVNPSGSFTRCRRKASSGLKPGRTNPGGTPATQTSGR
jgi:hypothetical protein